MQETADDRPGRCFAVTARMGEIVIVPPGWAHMTINASETESMVFGAFCDRDYGFVYDDVRKHRGLAWYPVFSELNGKLSWLSNPNYEVERLTEKEPRKYEELGLREGIPAYAQFEDDPDLFTFVSRPDLYREAWDNFVP